MESNAINIINKIVSEEIKNRVYSLKNKIFENKNMKKGMCEECGSGKMYEGMCEECGYSEGEVKENTEKGMCEECGSGKMYEGMCSECGYSEGEVKEGKNLSKGQKYIARQAKPYDKIDGEDFKKLRSNKSEVKERLYGRQSRIDANKNNKIDSEDFKMLRRKRTDESVTYKLVLDESTNEVFYFKENEVINIIENIVLEEKKKKTSKIPNITKDSQNKSKKENDDYLESVVKKMKDYLKVGSKGNYETNPKQFPKGNGELEKMEKMAYMPSNSVEEYIDNFTAAGLENLDYDEIHPNEDWVNDLLVGSSRTGNNPEWGNAVETPSNTKRNKIRKDNLLAKLKRKAYNKSPQPVVNDNTGNQKDKASKIMMKLESKEEKLVLEDIKKIKNLLSYGKKTQ
jgi:hypothetical protein